MNAQCVSLLLSLLLCLSRQAESRLTFREEKQILDEILSRYTGKKDSGQADWLDSGKHGSETDEVSQYLPLAEKRQDPEFNNCPNQDTPFPCKTEECISLQKICDGNRDCPDGYDEDQAVCIAYHRIPVDDLETFVASQAMWMVPAFFRNVVTKASDLKKIAHALAVSTTIDDFTKRLKMTRDERDKFKEALYAVRGNRMGSLESMGMDASEWSEVKIVLDNLIESGFLS